MAAFPGELFFKSKMGHYIRMKKGIVTDQQLKEYLKCTPDLYYSKKKNFKHNNLLFVFRRNVALLNVFYGETSGFVYRNDVRYDRNDFLCNYFKLD